MFTCIIGSIVTDKSGYFVPQQDSTFWLMGAKFGVTIAVHFNIHPFFVNSMNIMKYVNNHPHKFDNDNIAFLLGLIFTLYAFVFEAANLLVLFSRSTVYFAIGAYLTLEVIVLLLTWYFNNIIASDPTN